MVTEIKRDPKGCKWLFSRIEAKEIRNRRFNTHITVLNKDGELVAMSKYVSLVLERLEEGDLERIYRF